MSTTRVPEHKVFNINSPHDGYGDINIDDDMKAPGSGQRSPGEKVFILSTVSDGRKVTYDEHRMPESHCKHPGMPVHSGLLPEGDLL
jgi:hypothetical protein